jgi:hypothetical protein
VRELLLRSRVSRMAMVPVKRRYAFEDPAVPQGEQWLLKARCWGAAAAARGGRRRCCAVRTPLLRQGSPRLPPPPRI